MGLVHLQPAPLLLLLLRPTVLGLELPMLAQFLLHPPTHLDSFLIPHLLLQVSLLVSVLVPIRLPILPLLLEDSEQLLLIPTLIPRSDHLVGLLCLNQQLLLLPQINSFLLLFPPRPLPVSPIQRRPSLLIWHLMSRRPSSPLRPPLGPMRLPASKSRIVAMKKLKLVPRWRRNLKAYWI